MERNDRRAHGAELSWPVALLAVVSWAVFALLDRITRKRGRP